MRKLISVIIPIFNEENNINPIYLEIKKIFRHQSYDYELIFVDDGSKDKSSEIIKMLSSADSNIRLIEFSRNFGKEMATSAGLHESRGSAAIIIDADLQHPPRLIPEFIEKWKAGAEMVIGVRIKNPGAGLFKKFSSKIFYFIMRFISEGTSLPNSTDFRLVDRVVIDEFNRFTEHNRMTRGLLDWLGFKKDYIHFVCDKRKNGKPTYDSVKLFHLALYSFVNNSLFPLKFAGYLGIVIIFTSGPLGLFIFVNKHLLNDPLNLFFSGPTILVVINLFLIGIVLSCLGLIALYIGNIQNEVVNRPMYVIRNNKNNKVMTKKYEKNSMASLERL